MYICIYKYICVNDGDNDNNNSDNNGNIDDLKLNPNINFISLDINMAKTLNPMTHIYQFDVGFPAELLENIGHKFNTSLYTKYFISFQPPRYIINTYNFNVIFLHQLLTFCHGSGEGHTVYFYKKITDTDVKRSGTGVRLSAGLRVVLPKRR
jgi:hypothetical protein